MRIACTVIYLSLPNGVICSMTGLKNVEGPTHIPLGKLEQRIFAIGRQFYSGATLQNQTAMAVSIPTLLLPPR